MHCVHNRYLRIICIRSIISATLLSIKLEPRKYLLYLPHRRVFSGTKSKHFCTPYLVSSCSRSDHPSLRYWMLASWLVDRPSMSLSFSTLLFLFHLRLLLHFLSVTRTCAFLLGLPLLSPTSIPLLQSAHPCLPDLRILQEESFQVIRLYYRTDFDFFFLLLLPLAVRCSYKHWKWMRGVQVGEG